MKGKLLEPWWKFMEQALKQDLSPVLYRLAEELPRHAAVTENDQLFRQVAQVILNRRDKQLCEDSQTALLDWLDAWEKWVLEAQKEALKYGGSKENLLGTKTEDLTALLRFSAFWLDKMSQRQKWGNPALQEVGS